MQPGLDAALLGSLHALRTVAPLVLARGVDQAGRVKPVYPAVHRGGRRRRRRAGDLADRPDVTVRRFDERQGEGGAAVPTLSGVMARRLERGDATTG